MGLPVESHRACYRQRVNPLSSSGEEIERDPCDVGFRWSQFVFTLADVARASESRPPAPSLLMKCPEVTSKWGSCTPEWLPQKFSQVSSAASCLRSAVVLADTCLTRRRRRRKVIRVENPALWNTAGGVTTTVGSRFVRNGVVAESRSLNEQSLLEVDGRFSRFDSRLHLKSNTLESPDSDVHNCVPRNNLNYRSCRVSQTYFVDPQNTCAVSCGSAGEVENVPSLGHHFPAYLSDDKQLTDPRRKQSKDESSVHPRLVHRTMKALEASDQLRQRTAWALSQIFCDEFHY